MPQLHHLCHWHHCTHWSMYPFAYLLSAEINLHVKKVVCYMDELLKKLRATTGGEKSFGIILWSPIFNLTRMRKAVEVDFFKNSVQCNGCDGHISCEKNTWKWQHFFAQHQSSQCCDVRYSEQSVHTVRRWWWISVCVPLILFTLSWFTSHVSCVVSVLWMTLCGHYLFDPSQIESNCDVFLFPFLMFYLVEIRSLLSSD